MVRLAKPLLIGLAVVGVSACVQAPPSPPPPTTPSALEESALRVSTAMELLARTQASGEQARHGTLPAVPEPVGELATLVTLDFVGPLLQPVQIVAKAIGYTVAETGPRPAAPITVTVHADRQSAQAVLMSLGVQAGSQADLVISPRRQQIEVRYASPRRVQ